MPNSYIAKHKGAIMESVNDIIEYLIKNQEEVTDIIVSYRTNGGEMVVNTNTRDIITSLGMLCYAKEILMSHEREDDE